MATILWESLQLSFSNNIMEFNLAGEKISFYPANLFKWRFHASANITKNISAVKSNLIILLLNAGCKLSQIFIAIKGDRVMNPKV